MTDSHPPPHPPVSQFVLSSPPDTVGGNLNDTDTVRQCLETATRFFHDNLSSDVRAHITDKWGIQDKMIDARQIGYVDDTNDVVAQLLDAGYSPLNITRAGLGTAPLIKHIFECDGVSPDNTHLVDTATHPDAVAESCPHTVPERIDELAAALATDVIEPEAVDLAPVATYIKEKSGTELFVQNWWDNRITFPYKDEAGDVCYLIGRATDETDDIIYSNGIVDRSENLVHTVADTELAAELPFSDNELREFIIAPYFEDVYTAPDDNKHRDAADTAVETITGYKNNDQLPVDGVEAVGVTHEPGVKDELIESNTARVAVLNVANGMASDRHDTDVVLSPPALGIEPGTTIEFSNHTDSDVTVEVVGTPSGVWWDDSTVAVDETVLKDCGERGMYKYHVTGDGIEDMHGMVIAYRDVYTDTRNNRLEQWVGDEPNFNVDMAKYVKQTVDRGWVARDAVEEPIFGCGTVHDDNPLVVTEGVTDAIMAHQAGIPCVAPATTNFKQHHYDIICEHAAVVDTVYVVNDNEVSDAGLNGALRTAMVIKNSGHAAVVCELPQPAGQDKIDVAEFLQEHSRDEFVAVLQNGVAPDDHEKYDAARHDPSHRSGRSSRDSDGGCDGRDRSGAGRSSDVPSEALESSGTSALYSLELPDVIDFDALSGSRSGTTLYRGENPIQHHGNSTGYFVIRDHGEYVTAKDFKIESSGDGYYYDALTWLACSASCDCPPADRCTCTRTVTRPMGGLSDSEIFFAWRHAKQIPHIPVPDDDPVPIKAMWWIASHHTLIPDEFIPTSFDDDLRLPSSIYNDVLSVIAEGYGVDSGRSPRNED